MQELFLRRLSQIECINKMFNVRVLSVNRSPTRGIAGDLWNGQPDLRPGPSIIKARCSQDTKELIVWSVLQIV